MAIEALSVEAIRGIMSNIKKGFERANVQKSFLSYSDSDGRAVLEYDSNSYSYYHFHTRDKKVFELADAEAYFILKNIKGGKYKLTNLMQIIKNI